MATPHRPRALSRFAPCLLALAFLVCAGAVARAETRHALVVTNEAYYPELQPLAFTHSDGELISAALQSQGFAVRRLKDANNAAFRQMLQSFVQEVKAAGPDAVVFFYFSGHAAEDGVRNYLLLNERFPELVGIQTKAQERAAVEKFLSRVGVPMREVTMALAALKTKARFVVIDSHLDMEEPQLLETGQLLATQGRPGLNAADSNNYSIALSAALLTPGLDVDGVFRQVQVKVAEVTNGRQIPYFVNKLQQPFTFASPPPAAAKSIPAKEDDPWLEDPLWQSVANSANVRLLRVYLERFPQGKHAAEARAQIAEAERLASIAATPPPQPGRPAADPGRRVALVIGNSAYKNTNPLPNPTNDAKALAKAFRDLGFQDVQEHFDLTKEGMVNALKAFGETAKGADWAVVYYAGHGMEVKGINYLIPVEAKLADEEDVEDEAVRMSRLLDRLKDATGIKVLILDACRDNPLATRMFRRGTSRSTSGKGLAEVKADSGTLIAYATAPGDAAFDGDGEHSPYVRALLKYIGEPNLDIRLMLGYVLETVDEATKGRQLPWYSAQLSGRPRMFKPN